MCILSPWEVEDIAARRLAALIKAELGVEIDDRRLADFIVDHWTDIAKLSHAIHNSRRFAIEFVAAATAARPSSAAQPEGQPRSGGAAREAK